MKKQRYLQLQSARYSDNQLIMDKVSKNTSQFEVIFYIKGGSPEKNSFVSLKDYEKSLERYANINDAVLHDVQVISNFTGRMCYPPTQKRKITLRSVASIFTSNEWFVERGRMSEYFITMSIMPYKVVVSNGGFEYSPSYILVDKKEITEFTKAWLAADLSGKDTVVRKLQALIHARQFEVEKDRYLNYITFKKALTN